MNRFARSLRRVRTNNGPQSIIGERVAIMGRHENPNLCGPWEVDTYLGDFNNGPYYVL